MALDWQNGLPFSSRFGDVYFSTESGLEETCHVFLVGNRLAERYAELRSGESFTIGETGFGTGLNFICAWQLFLQTAQPNTSLDFFSIEKFPLDADELRAALALWPELETYANSLLSCWQRRVPGWNRWSFAGGRVRLTLVLGDVAEVVAEMRECAVNAWFLDGFSPAKNPEMWEEQVLSGIVRALRPGATFSTYTSAGWVRRGLQQAGFAVEKVPGYGRKREMLRGVITQLAVVKPSSKPSSGLPPRSAIVIGGGLAGCSVAYALASRGVAVKIVDSSPHLASAASGNPRGILHARFGASGNPMQRFILASYGHALALFDKVLPVDDQLRAECGLLQLGFSERESKRIAQLSESLSESLWLKQVLRTVDAEQATALVGIKMNYGGLWFSGGGWVVPPALCARLVDDARIEQQLGFTVETLTRIEMGWRVTGHGGACEEWSDTADAVFVCCAHSALRFEQFRNFPLTPVRGQISQLPATESSLLLHAVVCGDGYCSPALHGEHVTGATHAFNDESLEVRTDDHLENLAQLAAHVPALREALGKIDIWQVQGRASVRCSAPGSMPIVGAVQAGLYCSLAHGTRGLLSAGLAGETLAAMACGQLPPLPESILAAMAPSFRVHKK